MLGKRLIQKLEDQKKACVLSIISGQVSNFDSYKFLVGQIKGLEVAVDICKNTFQGEIDD
jgi:hypothetical protein